MIALALALQVTAPTRAARAHAGQPVGVTPMFEGDAFTGGATSFGLVFLEGATPRWVAEEALDQTVHWQAVVPGDRVLAGTFGGLFVSADRGCSWEQVPGALAQREVTDVAADPGDPARLYVTTSSGGVDNGVFASSDAGRTWSALGELRPQSFFKRVIVAPGGDALWTAGVTAGTLAPFVLRRDGDGPWQPVDAALEGPGGEPLADFRLFRVGGEPARFYAAARVGGEEQLLQSSDALATLQPRASFGSAEITGAGVLGDVVFVALDRLQLQRAALDGPFAPVEGGPTQCLIPGPRADELWGCGELRHRAGFLSTVDGETWTTALPFADVCPRTCPEGTEGEALNPSIWESLRATWAIGVDCPEGQDTDSDAGEGAGASGGEDSGAGAGGCACVLGSGPGAGWSLALTLGLLGLGRARRRRAAGVAPTRGEGASRRNHGVNGPKREGGAQTCGAMGSMGSTGSMGSMGSMRSDEAMKSDGARSCQAVSAAHSS